MVYLASLWINRHLGRKFCFHYAILSILLSSDHPSLTLEWMEREKKKTLLPVALRKVRVKPVADSSLLCNELTSIGRTNSFIVMPCSILGWSISVKVNESKIGWLYYTFTWSYERLRLNQDYFSLGCCLTLFPPPDSTWISSCASFLSKVFDQVMSNLTIRNNSSFKPK